MKNINEEHAFGAILSNYDERDYIANDYITLGVKPKNYIPKNLAPVLNQGNVGSCVAHSISTMVWYQENLEKLSETEYSHDFIYHNRKNTDHQSHGMIVREACANYCESGIANLIDLPTNTEYPNTNTKVLVESLKDKALQTKGLKYIKCETLDELADAIFQYGAGLLVVKVRSSFNSFWLKNKNNCMLSLPKDDERTLGYHCVCAIGYTEKGIIIQNSWGKNWGYNGLAIIPWNYPIEELRAVIDEKKNWDVITLTIGMNYAYFNDKAINLDTAPIIRDKRTFVPIRAIAELFGADVEYNKNVKIVMINNGDHKIELTIGDRRCFDGEKFTYLDVAPFIHNNRTYVPIRFISEALGADVEWIANKQKVIIRREVK